MRTTARFALSGLVTWFAGAAAAAEFRRGDSNIDGSFDISDAVKTLGVLFIGDPRPGCDDAMDSNDDGLLDIADGIYSLAALFTGGAVPKEPFGACGLDPTPDGLACADYAHCAPPCLSEALIDAAIARGIPPVVCVAPDQEVQAGAFVATVCPKAQSKACGPDEVMGCAVELRQVEGTLDLAGRKLSIHVGGHMEDFPISVKSVFDPTNVIECTFDVDFSGDLVIPFTVVTTDDGRQRLTGILDPSVQNAALEATAPQGSHVVCGLLATQEDQFIAALEGQLEAAAAGLIEQLRTAYVGALFCP